MDKGEIMSEDSAREIADDVFRHELKASEKMTQLFGEYDPEVAEQGMIESFDNLMGNIETSRRAQKAIMLMQTLAQRLESEALLERAIHEAENNEMVEIPQGQQ